MGPHISSYPGSVVMPLFPLNIVLFPGMPLPLQVFEERYHVMLHQCLTTDRKFGVALISDGVEVGGSARVWPVGTAAVIERVDPQDDGRVIVQVTGVQRFLILSRLPDDPYPRAIVTFLDDEPEMPADPALVARVQAMLDRYLMGIARANGQDWGDLSLPEDPAALGFMVGAVLSCPLAEKQRLLQTRSAAERLEAELPMLAAETEKQTAPPRYGIRPFTPGFKPSAN